MRIKRRILVRDILFLFIFNIALFQNPLGVLFSGFRYIDEVITLFFLLIIICHSKRLTKADKRIIIGLIVFITMGVFGNITAGIQREIQAIILDVFSFAKIFICTIGAKVYFKASPCTKSFKRTITREVHLLTIIGLLCAIVSQFIDIGMTAGIRHGIKSFKFIYSNPATFSLICLTFVVILTCDLQDSRITITKKLFILLAMFMWMSTLRSAAFAIIATWIAVMMIASGKFFENSKISLKRKIKKLLKPQYIISLFIAVGLISWSQFETYFVGDVNTARKLLLMGGISIIKDFFPVGTGFGTYGTEIAARYYSPLYYSYGLNLHWGLSENGTELTDCFWPAVGAECGVFGLLIMGLLIYKLSKTIIQLSKGMKYYLVSSVVLVIAMLILSTGNSIYTSYVMVLCIVICIAMENIK